MEPVRVDRFAGINNRQPIDRLRLRADEAWPVRDAVNVDLSASGTFQSRLGFTKHLELSRARDLWETGYGALLATDAELHFFDGEQSSKVADVASAYARIAYTDSPLGVIWSDGRTLNVYKGISKRLAPAMPNPGPTVEGASGGALAAGSYGVCFAAVRPDGQRSAMTIPARVSVPASGRIAISSFAQTDAIDVFVTAVDGEVFYRVGRIEVGQSSVDITVSQESGQPISYEVQAELPAGSILALHNGRLLSAQGDYLFFSLPFQYGVHRPAFDFVPFPGAIRVVAPVSSGVFVATDQAHYLLAGPDVATAELRAVYPFGAARGTARPLPNSTGLMWFTDRGPIAASDDGSLALLQDQQIAFGRSDEGASLFREQDGMRRFISSVRPARRAGGAVLGSFIMARVLQE